MSIDITEPDITEQAGYIRRELDAYEFADAGRPPSADTLMLRAILATLERVAAEERPERMQ